MQRRPPIRRPLRPAGLSSWDRDYLDIRHRAIGHQLAYVGILPRAAVEPRGILTAALLSNVAGLTLFHNYPSGAPSPSAEDLPFTRRMAETGEIVGVRVLDHIIVGEAPAFVSLRHRGGW